MKAVIATEELYNPPVVVGGKNFTEQRILGELVAQTLERAGMGVERRLDLGGTLVCDTALRAGAIDVYVEYTGTALTAVLHEPPAGDAAAVRARVDAAYETAGLVWLPPLGFDNTFALVVRPDAGVGTISAAVARAPAWQAAFGPRISRTWDLVHLVSGLGTLVLLAVHLLLALLRRRQQARQVPEMRRSIGRFGIGVAACGAAATAVVLMSTSFWPEGFRTPIFALSEEVLKGEARSSSHALA